MTLCLELDDTLPDRTVAKSFEPRTAAKAKNKLGCRAGEHYTLSKLLGRGGMGEVYLAQHDWLGTLVAVKVMPARGVAALRRLSEEAVLLSQQQHPNIVTAVDFGTLSDGSAFLMMEYVAGLDIAEWLRLKRTLPVWRILDILRQLASAVDHIHAQGIVHRDIKPSNIMLDLVSSRRDVWVKLIDFGIAVREGATAERTGSTLLGTPAYMAPEQALGDSCQRASDLYALGALALELLTGKPPYDCHGLSQVLAAVLYEKPLGPSAHGLYVPGLDAFFERALAREPSARFASAGELVAALTAIFERARATFCCVPTGRARVNTRLLATDTVVAFH